MGVIMWLSFEDSTIEYYQQEAPSEAAKEEIPQNFVPIYQEAGKHYGVPWQVLAAIHKVETDFSQNVSRSSAGAIGHTQFMPCTWVGWKYPYCDKKGDITKPIDITNPQNIAKFGGYGVDANGDGKADPNDLVDAIHTTAKYLASNGAADEIDQAIYRYNHSNQYVKKVLYYSSHFIRPAISYEDEQIFIWPTTLSNITSQFGYRIHPIKKKKKLHAGIDISGPDAMGKPVYASASGKMEARTDPYGYGNYIVIDHGNGYSTLYGHLSKVYKQSGMVQQGELIGAVGNTGGSTGAHLHFEVLKNGVPQQPLNYVRRP